MRATTCEEIEDLIEREALGWSEADRLRVEQHLSDCEACSETLAVSRFVRETLRDAAGELSDAARSRAIQAALLNGRPKKTLRPVPRRILGASAVVLSVAAAVGLVLYVAQSGTQQLAHKPAPHGAAQPKLASAPAASAPAEPAKAAEAAPPSQPEAQPAPDGARLAEAAPGAEADWIETSAPAQHRFAHANVELAAQTRARFDAAHRTLELAHGRVDVDVDPTRGKSFAVVTEHFRVEVLGTHFSVTPSSVSVTRGRVQVFGRDGRVLARQLAAGGSYHYGAVSQSLEQASTTALGVPRSSEPSVSSASGAKAQPASAAEPKPSVAPAKSAATWLREAHEALARGDSQSARTLVGSAEASAPTRSQRAEGSTLRAEASLLERDPAAALRLYREVGAQYADLAAGDNAAFAAAQLAARADKVHERELLESYLAHFPNGRFRDEAKQRLARLAR